MKIIFLGCGYLGYNLAQHFNQHAQVEVIGLPSPYTELCPYFKTIDAFSAQDLDQVDFQDAIVFDTISLLGNNAKSDQEREVLDSVLSRYTFLLHELKQRGVQRYLFLSSGGTVYGNSNEPIEETASLQPISLYARSKVMCEELIRQSGLSYLILRLANPYGGHQTTNKKQGVIPILIEKALNHELFEMWVSDQSCRDYIYIDDFALAVQSLLDNNIKNETINIGSQSATSLATIIQQVENLTQETIEINVVKSDVPVVDTIVLNIEKLKRLTDFHISIGIKEGIQKEVHRIVTERKENAK